ncbi:Cell division protein FtsL [gamma proteobacterium IMCC2047]|nr:Cell division protein FtsL [gamma proteobacterium IMCC2047]
MLTLFSKEFVATVSLLCLLVMSAVAVVYVSHLNRHAFSDFQAALQERDSLDIEWGQLLLEQSALAQHARVEQIARARLAMRVPEAKDIVLVQW